MITKKAVLFLTLVYGSTFACEVGDKSQNGACDQKTGDHGIVMARVLARKVVAQVLLERRLAIAMAERKHLKDLELESSSYGLVLSELSGTPKSCESEKSHGFFD